MKSFRILVGTAFLLLAACSNPREKALKTLQEVGARKLRLETALLYVRMFAGHGTDFLVIPSGQYPDTFKRFAPIRVGAYPDGLSITLRANSREEAGLYVVPAEMDHVPNGSAATHFQKIADGIYWYSFEI